jgi:site-specific DNA-methyltransferase (adenine-specific)
MIQLHKGDCLIISDNIESGSVDLILTDLPYGTIKGIRSSPASKTTGLKVCEWDNVIDINKVYNIANRILRKNGKMILFCQEPFTTELITKAIPNVPFCYRIIWEKDHYANALLSKKAPVNYYEDILVFSKSKCYNAPHPLVKYAKEVIKYIDKPIKEITSKTNRSLFYRVTDRDFGLPTLKGYLQLIDIFNIDKMQGFKEFAELKKIDNQFKKQYASTFNLWEGKKYKSNILKYKKDYDGYHPTQKPVLLLEDLIKTFSNPKDLVVDLTMGSGSTGVACVNTKRSFIGIEQDDKYFTIAQDRIDNAQRQSLIDFPTQ